MRPREQIQKPMNGPGHHEERTLEVLLDIRELLQGPRTSAVDQVSDTAARENLTVQKLEEVVQALSDGLDVEAELKDAYLDGARKVFDIMIGEQGKQEAFFKAIVDPGGLPVTLDFFEGSNPVCRTVEEIPLKVITFVIHPDVQRFLVKHRG